MTQQRSIWFAGAALVGSLALAACGVSGGASGQTARTKTQSSSPSPSSSATKTPAVGDTVDSQALHARIKEASKKLGSSHLTMMSSVGTVEVDSDLASGNLAALIRTDDEPRQIRKFGKDIYFNGFGVALPEGKSWIVIDSSKDNAAARTLAGLFESMKPPGDTFDYAGLQSTVTQVTADTTSYETIIGPEHVQKFLETLPPGLQASDIKVKEVTVEEQISRRALPLRASVTTDTDQGSETVDISFTGPASEHLAIPPAEETIPSTQLAGFTLNLPQSMA